MLRSRFFAVLALVTPAAIALVAACADQTNESFPETTDAGGTPRRDGGGGGSEEEWDSATSEPKDSGAGKPDANCTAPVAPVEDGGGQCGTIEFGLAAAPFGGIDAGDTGYNRGGVIPPGIYDAVAAERGAGVGGSIRETLVVLPNGRFTRTRQLDTGNGPGPLSRRSGAYKYSDAGVTFTYDCATNDGAFIDAGSDTFPYEYVEGAGECQKGVYRFGLTSLRFTHQRR